MRAHSAGVLAALAVGAAMVTAQQGAGPAAQQRALPPGFAAPQSPAPDFVAEYTFTGSQLAGWQPAGAADWRAQNGVITGTARAGGAGGILLFDKSYQDVGYFARFRCAQACDAGLLLRAEKTPTGMKGILVSLTGTGIAPERVTFDTNGRLLTREVARNPGRGGGGGAAAPAGGAGGRAGGAAPAPAPPMPPSATLTAATAAMAAPVTITAGQWNSIEVILDAAAIFNHLNGVRNAIPGGTTGETNEFGYGPVGLFVGSGSVEFDAVSVKDFNLTSEPAEQTSNRFRVQRLTDFYYSWGADAADINRDGVTDIVAGGFYYIGPRYTDRREIYPVKTYNPGTEYVDDMITFVSDFTGDGYPDLLSTERRPIVMYVNPKGENRRWQRVAVLPEVCSEGAVKADIDGDGKPEIVYVGGDGRVAYGRPDPANPIAPWIVRKVSEPMVAGCNTHGVGAGDINGDGRIDILQARGWWEQPASNQGDALWKYHETSFGKLTRSPQHPGGGEIAVYDFNGDRLNDVVASHSAHGWGLSWYEQKRDAAGVITFVEHPIMGDYSTANAGGVTFSQVHSGATLVDADRDGVMDFVTGKRHWSHLDAFTDPDPYGPGVVYLYRTVRNPQAPGGVQFVPELIHNRSGVGSEVKALDINRDGATDLITSGTRGAFVFWGVR